jgi:hypothetical protein
VLRLIEEVKKSGVYVNPNPLKIEVFHGATRYSVDGSKVLRAIHMRIQIKNPEDHELYYAKFVDGGHIRSQTGFTIIKITHPAMPCQSKEDEVPSLHFFHSIVAAHNDGAPQFTKTVQLVEEESCRNVLYSGIDQKFVTDKEGEKPVMMAST